MNELYWIAVDVNSLLYVAYMTCAVVENWRIKDRWLGCDFDFLWYDFWVGAFWDAKKRKLYLVPIPCFVYSFYVYNHDTDKTAARHD